MKIGELLVKNGIINEAQLTEALAIQKEKHKRLGELLIDLGYITLKDLVWMISEQVDIPFVEIKPEMLDNRLISSFPENILQEKSILPLIETEDAIYIAVGDPTDRDSINALNAYTNKRIIASGAETDKIHQMLDKYYLSQQTDMTIMKHTPGLPIIRIISDQATIESVDQVGKIKISKGKIDITIELEKNPGNHKNE